MAAPLPFPEVGRPADEIMAELAELRTGDLDWRNGRAFSLVYHADDAELEGLLHDVAAMFLHENALNPFRYQTLLKMETELASSVINQDEAILQGLEAADELLGLG